MARAHAADPRGLAVLLALGVSHTNELDQGEALAHLRWEREGKRHVHHIHTRVHMWDNDRRTHEHTRTLAHAHPCNAPTLTNYTVSALQVLAV
jgi:peroxin-5